MFIIIAKVFQKFPPMTSLIAAWASEAGDEVHSQAKSNKI